MKRADEVELEAEVPGLAQHQCRTRDLAVIRLTLAACQESVNKWLCCPPIRIDPDEILKAVSAIYDEPPVTDIEIQTTITRG